MLAPFCVFASELGTFLLLLLLLCTECGGFLNVDHAMVAAVYCLASYRNYYATLTVFWKSFVGQMGSASPRLPFETGDLCRNPIGGVQQGCLLSPTLFNIFLERILTDSLEDREGTVTIGGGTITNLRFADDIDGLVGEKEDLAKLVERLDKASTAYGMEISAEKTKLMTNNTCGINTKIEVNGQKLETVTSFKYLGSVYCGEIPAWDTLQDSTDNSSIDKVETSLE